MIMEMVGVPAHITSFVVASNVIMSASGWTIQSSRLVCLERRTAWIIEFIKEMVDSDWLVNVKRFQEFHGRLGFSAQVLPWLRPLLSPGYA